MYHGVERASYEDGEMLVLPTVLEYLDIKLSKAMY